MKSKFEFCGTLQQLYDTNQAYTSEGLPIPATGLSSENNLITIRNIVLESSPKQTMEIGLAYGGSALTILSTMAEIHPETDAFNHTAIDPGQSEFGMAGIEMVRRSGLGNHFRCVHESSATALPELLKAGDSFGFIYIDGYHIFEHVFTDMFYSLMLLEPGGTVLFDDCADPHVSKVIKFIRSNLSEQLRPLDLSPFQPSKSAFKRIANRFGYSQAKAFTKTGDLPRPWNVKFSRF